MQNRFDVHTSNSVASSCCWCYFFLWAHLVSIFVLDICIYILTLVFSFPPPFRASSWMTTNIFLSLFFFCFVVLSVSSYKCSLTHSHLIWTSHHSVHCCRLNALSILSRVLVVVVVVVLWWQTTRWSISWRRLSVLPSIDRSVSKGRPKMNHSLDCNHWEAYYFFFNCLIVEIVNKSVNLSGKSSSSSRRVAAI